jgi:hypothetical protein
MVFLMHQFTQFYNKQINTTVLVFVYCVDVLLHVFMVELFKSVLCCILYERVPPSCCHSLGVILSVQTENSSTIVTQTIVKK